MYSGVLAFALALTLIFFGGFHLYLILTDQTTIEANAIFRNFFSHIGRKSHQKIPFRENWCIVMDRKWYLVNFTYPLDCSGSFLFIQTILNLNGIFYMRVMEKRVMKMAGRPSLRTGRKCGG